MAKLHTHYVTNAQKKLKYAYAGVSEDDFQSSVQEALSEANRNDELEEDDDDDFFDNDGDDDDDNEEGNHNSNIRDTDIEKWVDINDLELKKLLNIEVNVVIEPPHYMLLIIVQMYSMLKLQLINYYVVKYFNVKEI